MPILFLSLPGCLDYHSFTVLPSQFSPTSSVFQQNNLQILWPEDTYPRIKPEAILKLRGGSDFISIMLIMLRELKRIKRYEAIDELRLYHKYGLENIV